MGWCDVEGAAQLHEGLELGVATAALEQRDVGAVQAGGGGEVVL
ncbi:MAG TPA: hypothetical protein VK272_12070 [Solirubrobacteraceae bacterium]|nr:hypothetical protein [Solirubrobacteraceae bacterium]